MSINPNMSATTPSPPFPPPPRHPKSRPKPPPPDWLCAECNTNTTPVRRGGPHGRATLCNACGLRLAKRKRSAAAAAAAAATTTPNPANQPSDPASEGTADEDSRGLSVSSGNAHLITAEPKKGKKRRASAARIAGRGCGRKHGRKRSPSSGYNSARSVASRSSKEESQVEIRPNTSGYVESDNCPIVSVEEISKGSKEQDQAAGATEGNEPQAVGEPEIRSKEEEATHAQHDQESGVLKWQAWHGGNSRVHRAREKAQNDASAAHVQEHCVQFSIRNQDSQGQQSKEMAALHHSGMTAVLERARETQTGQAARLAEQTIIAEGLRKNQEWEMAERDRAELERAERDRALAPIAAQQQQLQHNQRQLRQENILKVHAKPSQPVTNCDDTIGVEEFFEERSGGQSGALHSMFRQIGNTEEMNASRGAGRDEGISMGDELADNAGQLDDTALPVPCSAQLPYEAVRSAGGERNVDPSGSLDAPGVGMQALSSAEGIEWMPNPQHPGILHTQMPPSVFQQAALSQQQQGRYHRQASHHEEMTLTATANRSARLGREQEVPTVAHVQPRQGPSMQPIRRIRFDDMRDANREEIRANTPHLTEELLERLGNSVRDLSRFKEEFKALDARAKVVSQEILQRKLEVATLNKDVEIISEAWTNL